MAEPQDHLAELLRLPIEARARAARALLDSLDEEGDDSDAEQTQVTELMRRMKAFDAAKVGLVDDAASDRSELLRRLNRPCRTQICSAGPELTR